MSGLAALLLLSPPLVCENTCKTCDNVSTCKTSFQKTQSKCSLKHRLENDSLDEMSAKIIDNKTIT